MAHWQEGRQGGGYLKMRLFETARADAYVLKFLPGATVKPHTDPVPGRRHFRLNIELRKADRGGVFYGGRPLFQLPRIVLFRSDLHPHAVSTVEEGMRMVLSLGLAI